MESSPIELFQTWFDEANAAGEPEPDAFALATADAGGEPSVRMLLLKGVSEAGFVFYTNLGSRKVSDLAANPRAAMCFHWRVNGRQVRVRGEVAPVSDAEADAYFASRPRTSRIGAWASRQSEPLEGRFELERAVAKYTARFAVGRIPRPEWWSGFRLAPAEVEFWQKRPFRLHDRWLFEREAEGWVRTALYP